MKNYTLLYAEDEIETRKNHIAYIQTLYADINILEASDGKEAWDIYLKNKPDILITDLSMPNMCGLELIEKIREKDTDIKIIVVSAHSDQERLLKAIPMQLEDYQIKPLNRKKLNFVIDKVINLLDKNQDKYYLSKTTYFDFVSKNLFENNTQIKLTINELALLQLFIKNFNVILKSEYIFNEIWNFNKEYKVDSIRTLVKKLRKKIPFNCIENIYGGNYRLIQ